MWPVKHPDFAIGRIAVGCGPFIQIRALPAARLFKIKAWGPIATYPSRPFRETLRPSAELGDGTGGGIFKQMTNAPWICFLKRYKFYSPTGTA